MTITTTETVERYVGDGTQSIWPITFPFFDHTDVKACIVNNAGEQVDLTYGTDYSVTKSTSSLGGTLRYALEDGQEITIWLSLPITQGTDFYNTGPLNAETLEDAFDRLTLIAQQLQEESRRSIKVATSSSDTPEMLQIALFAGCEAAVASAGSAADSAASALSSATLATTTVNGALEDIDAAKDAKVDEAEEAIDDIKDTKVAEAGVTIAALTVDAESAADNAASSASAAASSATNAASSATSAASFASSANSAWQNLSSATATSESVDSWCEANVTLSDGTFHFTIPKAEDGAVPVGLSLAQMEVGATDGHLRFTVHQCSFDTADAYIDDDGYLFLTLEDTSEQGTNGGVV